MATVFRQPVVTAQARTDRSRALLSQLNIGRNIALILSLVAALPFALDDQPNPQRRAVQQYEAGTRNIALLTPAAVKPPGQRFDAENPRGRPFPQDLRTWTQNTRLVSDQIATFRAPLITRYQRTSWRGAASQDGVESGLALTAPQISKPFIAVEWANPRSKPFPIDLRTFLQSQQLTDSGTQPPVTWTSFEWVASRTVAMLSQGEQSRFSLGLSAPIVAPFSQDDWANPRGPIFSVELRTWTQRMRLVVDPVLTPVAFDWPNPRGAARALPHEVQRNLALQLATVAAAPFGLDTWPVPRGARRAVQPEPAINTVLLQPIAAAPFGLDSWPVPRGARRAVQPEPATNTVLLQPIAVAPFGIDSWPVPRGARRAAQPDQARSIALLQPAASVPFINEDMPNPQRPRVASYEVGSYNVTLLSIAPVPVVVVHGRVHGHRDAGIRRSAPPLIRRT